MLPESEVSLISHPGVVCGIPQLLRPLATRMVKTGLRRALEPLGFDDRLEKLFRPFLAEGLQPGRVARVDRGSSYVITAGDPVRAKTPPHLHRDHLGLAPPTVGDWVAFRVDEDGRARIEHILPRTS